MISVITQSEVLRYLGYGNNKPDEKIQNMLDVCCKKMLDTIKPHFLYRVFDISFMPDGIHLANCNLILSGNDIQEHLKGCTKAALMCATLSADTDTLIRNAQIHDMAEAVILDSAASVCIEQVCDTAEMEIHEKLPEYYHTWRYSAGYGDLPIDIQTKFLDVLDAPRRIGLCTNASNILTPKKSVTAVIGLSQTPLTNKHRGCQTCNLHDTCQYRRKGEHCGF